MRPERHLFENMIQPITPEKNVPESCLDEYTAYGQPPPKQDKSSTDKGDHPLKESTKPVSIPESLDEKEFCQSEPVTLPDTTSPETAKPKPFDPEKTKTHEQDPITVERETNRTNSSISIHSPVASIPNSENIQPKPVDRSQLQYAPDHPKVQNTTYTKGEKEILHFASDHGVLEDHATGFGGYIWVGFCFVTSFTFCLFGLTWLLSCAVFSVAKKKYKHKKQNKRDGVIPQTFPRLDKTNKKLKSSLEYYIQARGYEMEVHTVTTSDGFILEMQHIVNPNDTPEAKASRYPVMLLHGLLQAAAAYASSGEHSLAFFLLESGYDVWLANNRNGFRPRHTSYKYLDLKFWSWRIREMGTRDLPAMIDHVLNQTGAEKLALVAHSQGTSETFLALSKDWMPEIGDKISGFVALAPAVYGGKLLDRYFLKWVRNFDLPGFRFFFGHHGFFSIMMQMRAVLPFKMFCYCGHIMFSYLFEWNDYLWDKRYRDRQFVFSPVYVSAELMHWWVGKGGFADRGCIFEHDDTNVPWFNEKLPPVCIVAPGLDDLVNPQKLVERFSDVESKFFDHDVTVVNVPHYSHVDVLWAIDTIETIGVPMKDFIWRTRKDMAGREWSEPINRIIHVPSMTS